MQQYGTIIFVILGISCFVLPAQFCKRIFNNKLKYFIPTNCCVKILIVLFGCAIIPIKIIFSSNINNEILAVLIGLLCGFSMVAIEKKVNRSVNRSVAINNTIFKKEHSLPKNRLVTLSLTSKAKILYPHETKAIFFIDNKRSASYWLNYGIISIFFLAITEELIFRGFFVSVSKELPTLLLTVIFLFISTFIFGWSHIIFGTHQAMLKGFFGLILLIVTLLLHTVIAAIVAHTVLNIASWYLKNNRHYFYHSKNLMKSI